MKSKIFLIIISFLLLISSSASVFSEPNIIIIHPTESTSYSTDYVDLNYSVNESTDWIAYSLDSQANVTLSGNTTLSSLSEGTHTVIIYGNDTSGNMGSSSLITFNVDTIGPNATIINPTESATYATSDVDLNWTIDDAPDWCAYILDDNMTDIEYCARKINYLDVIYGAGSPNYLDSPRSLFVVDDIAYITSKSDNALTTFNISDPNNIVHLGNITGLGSPNYLNSATFVYVINNIAYVASTADNALTIFNVSDPSNIVHIGAITGAGSPNYLDGSNNVFVIDDIAYVSAWKDNAVSTFNISDPYNIVHLGVINGSPNYFGIPSGIFVVNNILYLRSEDGIFTTFNVTDPINIIYLNNVSGAGSPNYLGGGGGLKVIDDIAYITSIDDNALTIFNVSDPSNIVHLGYISGDGSYNVSPYLLYAKSVYVKNDIAYVTAEDSLTIFDVSDPTNIVHLDAVSGFGSPYYLGDAWDVGVVDDGIVFVISKSDNSLVAYKFNVQESITLTGLSDGTHNIKITANDSSGNIGNSSLVTFSVNTTVPQFSNQVKNTTPYINDYVGMNITITDLYPDSYKFFWNTTGTFVNDTAQTYTSGETVSTSKQITTAHQNVCWGYWANDTFGNSDISSLDCFTVQNSIPIQGTPTVSSSPTNSNTTNETLYCYNNTQSDLDEDELTRTFLWYKNDIETAETSQSVSSSSTSKTEQWKCEVSLYDGYDYNRKNSTTLTILNSPPEIGTPTLNDSVPKTNDVLLCQNGSYSDVDSDSLSSWYYRWYENDVLIGGQTSSTLDLTLAGLDKDDVILCEIRASDGIDYSEYKNSSTATVQNTLPTTPTVTSPLDGNNYTSVDIEYSSFDLDGDTITYYSYIDNVLNQTSQNNITNWEASDGTYTLKVSAYDGYGFSDNSTPISFTLDTTGPSINYEEPTPADSSRQLINSVTINISYSNGVGVDTCLLEWNNVNETFDNSDADNYWETKSTTDGVTYTFDVYCNDTLGNLGSSGVRSFVENTKPTVPSIIYPEDNYNYTSVTHVDYTSSDAEGDTITYYTYVDDILNKTLTTNITSINFADGIFKLDVSAYDGYEFSVNSTIYFTVDSVGPTIYSSNATAIYMQSVFNITTNVSDDLGVNQVLVEVEEPLTIKTNYTMTLLNDDIYNYTYGADESGTHNYLIYAFDKLNNVNSGGAGTFETVYDVTIPQFSNQVINATPYLNEYVEMNITITDDNADSYIFFWNETGSFVNDTPSTYTSGVAISTIKQTTTPHQTICYGYYANDTLGNYDTSSLSCFTVANSISTTPTVTSPSDGYNYTTVDIEYSSPADIDGDTITYYSYIDDVLNQTSQNNISNWEASDGTYTLKVSAYDGYDFSDNSTSIFFTLDATGPIITVLTPVDYETYNKVPVWINFTTNENSLCSVNNSYWTLDVSTLTSFSFSNDNSTPNDFYSILISCNDSLINIGTKNIYFTLDTDAPIIHSITPAEDNSTSIYIMQLPSEQFTLNVTVDDNLLVHSYSANITKKSDSTLMWSYVNTSVNLMTFNFIKTLNVGSWENTTYIYDNEVCNGISCVREIYEFEFNYPYPPVITVYNPTPVDVDGGIGETINFDIEVDDNNTGDIITYDWQVDFVGVSTDEDYDYLIETGHIGLVYNVLVTATDDSPLTLSDTESWNITITSGHYTDYDTRDFSKIVIDGMGTAGAAVVGWTDVLIILAILTIITTTSVVFFRKFKYKY